MMPCKPTGFNIYLEIGTVICRPGTGGRGKMRIAICEDNQEHANVLKGMIQKWTETEEIKVDMNYYESAEQFLYYWEKGEPYDLIFMDIQMNRMNGMELARYIRQQDRAVFIIFTSGLLNYVFKGYEVSAFRFLRKPLQEKDVLAALRRRITRWRKESGQPLSFLRRKVLCGFSSKTSTMWRRITIILSCIRNRVISAIRKSLAMWNPCFRNRLSASATDPISSTFTIWEG